WSVKLSADDIDWLLADGLERVPDHERRLAINVAIVIWGAAGSPDDLRERIGASVKDDAVMTQAFESWLRPPQHSAEETESRRELKRLERRNAVERAKADKSWVDFAARLRANPDEMRNLTPTSAKGADAKLFGLWR